MATAVDELLDMLFDMIDEAKNAPLSSEKCIIERDKALDLIEDIKAQFPVELAEAKKGAQRPQRVCHRRQAGGGGDPQAGGGGGRAPGGRGPGDHSGPAEGGGDPHPGGGEGQAGAPGGQRVLRGRAAPHGRGPGRRPLRDAPGPHPVPRRHGSRRRERFRLGRQPHLRCGGRGKLNPEQTTKRPSHAAGALFVIRGDCGSPRPPWWSTRRWQRPAPAPAPPGETAAP